MKCELYISRMHGASEGRIVRIEARDGRALIGRIEVSLEGFAEALMGTAAVPATFATIREVPSREATP